MSKKAVLLLAHGTVDSIEEIPEYLSNVTSGRPMPQHVIEEIQHRYQQIGHSPLTRLTLEQGCLLSTQIGTPVYVGMRNWRPYIADVMQQMRADGITEATVICLAPQNSRTSVGLYRRAVQSDASGIELHFIDAWADHPSLIDAFADRLLPLWQHLKKETGADVPVLFTAHSVPQRTIDPQPGETADPYADQSLLTAKLVAERAGISNWRFAFQSQGMSGGPWIGPTVENTLDAIAAKGAKVVILQPIGFLCDHIEILYDIDISFRAHAANLGMRLERPESLNDSPLLTKALADLAANGFTHSTT